MHGDSHASGSGSSSVEDPIFAPTEHVGASTLAEDDDRDGDGDGDGETLGEGFVLGHYELREVLGRGGMGIVYAAHDRTLDRLVAIKTLRDLGDPKLRARLLREAKAMAKLSHVNVVRVYEIGETAGMTFIVMEYVEGQSLRRWLAAEARSPAAILETFAAAGRGLAAIHDKGLIHRDFKPDNVMVDAGGRVLVMDLGIARAELDGAEGPASRSPSPWSVDDGIELTRTGTLLGSPGYMAPEQFAGGGGLGPHTDQFAFCVALWEALCGERPFADDGGLLALMKRVTHGTLREPPAGKLSPALRWVLERGLAVAPEARFASMPALLEALAAVAPAPDRSQRRRRWWWATAIATAIVGVLAASARLSSGRVGGSDADRSPRSAGAELELETGAPTPMTTAAPTGPRQLSDDGGATFPVLSDDGERLTYLEAGPTPGTGAFVEIELASGQTRRQPIDAFIRDLRAREGGGLTYAVRHEDVSIYGLARLGAEPEALAKRTLFLCELSRSGRRVSLEFFDAKAIDVLGSTPETIAIPGDYEWLLDLDCDQRHERVVVQYGLGKVGGLILVDLARGTQTRLVEVEGSLASPRFSADGETLYYLSGRVGHLGLRALALPDDDSYTPPRELLPGVHMEGPISVRGDRIAYTTVEERFELWRLEPDQQTLAEGRRLLSSEAEAMTIALSPDGTQLAYVESHGDHGRLLTLPSTGGTPRELYRTSELGRVAWSPDGQTLAFASARRGRYHLWTMPAAGGEVQPWEDAVISEDNNTVIWAPSDRIAFQRPGNRDFGLLDPSSGAIGSLLGEDSPGWVFGPQPAADGRRLALFWNRPEPGQDGLWLLEGEGAARRARLLVMGMFMPIGWSADGRHVYAMDEQQTGVVRISAADGQLERWRELEIGRREAACLVAADEALLCRIGEHVSNVWVSEGLEAR